jgi:hypothetical protein
VRQHQVPIERAWGLDPFKPAKSVVGESGKNRLQAFRPLGVIGSGVVFDAGEVRNEKRTHGGRGANSFPTRAYPVYLIVTGRPGANKAPHRARLDFLPADDAISYRMRW